MVVSSSKMAELANELLKTIRATQELRSNVSHVFERLGDGAQGKEHVFLSELQRNLLSVNTALEELEKLGQSLPSTSVSLGNSSLLALDPVLDKTMLYPQLLQSYKWSNKLHVQAAVGASLLTQNPLKRSHLSGLLSASKRARRSHSTSHSVAPKHVDGLVQTLDRQFSDMSITSVRPLGSPAFLQISLGRTLRAVIILRGLIIERVAVRGYREEAMSDEKIPEIWLKSKHLVFNKVTDHATAAMLHFHSPFIADQTALHSFMTWLHSYLNLFSAACRKCGRYMQHKLPPTWRDFRTLDPYHEACRP